MLCLEVTISLLNCVYCEVETHRDERPDLLLRGLAALRYQVHVRVKAGNNCTCMPWRVCLCVCEHVLFKRRWYMLRVNCWLDISHNTPVSYIMVTEGRAWSLNCSAISPLSMCYEITYSPTHCVWLYFFLKSKIMHVHDFFMSMDTLKTYFYMRWEMRNFLKAQSSNSIPKNNKISWRVIHFFILISSFIQTKWVARWCSG